MISVFYRSHLFSISPIHIIAVKFDVNIDFALMFFITKLIQVTELTMIIRAGYLNMRQKWGKAKRNCIHEVVSRTSKTSR